ncbi:MAG: hypothetical protein ACTSSP_07240 [Candidatus Asgardarchaeia archaeon]
MRFIRREHIVTTIFNKELSDIDTIKIVFKNLYDHRIEFSMTMKKWLPHQEDFFNLDFEKVRVLKIYEDQTLDLLAFKKGVKTTMKRVPFAHVVEINATTKKHKILDIDDDITRWDILDL